MTQDELFNFYQDFFPQKPHPTYSKPHRFDAFVKINPGSLFLNIAVPSSLLHLLLVVVVRYLLRVVLQEGGFVLTNRTNQPPPLSDRRSSLPLRRLKPTRPQSILRLHWSQGVAFLGRDEVASVLERGGGEVVLIVICHLKLLISS